jgi:hypothetical protein
MKFKITVPCAVYPLFELLIQDLNLDFIVTDADGNELPEGFGARWNAQRILDHIAGDYPEYVIEDRVFFDTMVFYTFASDKHKLKIQRAAQKARESL